MNVPPEMHREEFLDQVFARVAGLAGADKSDSELFLRRQRPGDGVRYNVRVKHADSSESVLYSTRDPEQLEAWLRGVEAVVSGEWHTKLDRLDILNHGTAIPTDQDGDQDGQ
jgi:hypothetical protein